MILKRIGSSCFSILLFVLNGYTQNSVQKNPLEFNFTKDLLLVHFDCKTDVDDIHSVAALATLLSNPKYKNINFHAVAGTYGIQKGKYVPANALFQLAFGNHWADAHNNCKQAIMQVAKKAAYTLLNNGDIWIAEAGQSDFTAKLIKHLQKEIPKINTSKRVHVVQHGVWNEKNTLPKNLDFVMNHTNYFKIPDGNAVGNGTPGFRDSKFTAWKTKITHTQNSKIWELASTIANRYNGQEGRYKNEAIHAGGLDFSDLSEVCWILGITNLHDTSSFFELFVN